MEVDWHEVKLGIVIPWSMVNQEQPASWDKSFILWGLCVISSGKLNLSSWSEVTDTGHIINL